MAHWIKLALILLFFISMPNAVNFDGGCSIADNGLQTSTNMCDYTGDIFFFLFSRYMLIDSNRKSWMQPDPNARNNEVVLF